MEKQAEFCFRSHKFTKSLKRIYFHSYSVSLSCFPVKAVGNKIEATDLLFLLSINKGEKNVINFYMQFYTSIVMFYAI